MFCSSNPVAADCVCLVPCPLFYTDRQMAVPAKMIYWQTARISPSTQIFSYSLHLRPTPINTCQYLALLFCTFFFVFSPSRPAILAWCRLNKDVNITPHPESNLRLDDSLREVTEWECSSATGHSTPISVMQGWKSPGSNTGQFIHINSQSRLHGLQQFHYNRQFCFAVIFPFSA